MLDPPKKDEAFIIPPDPAIVEGECEPGAKIYNDPAVQSDELPPHAHTVPLTQAEHSNSGSGSSMKEDGYRAESVPLRHSTSAPSSIPSTPAPMEIRPSMSYHTISSERGHTNE